MKRDSNSEALDIEISRIWHRGEDRILLSFRYDEKLINKIKKILGRKYTKTYKSWYLPYDIKSIHALRNLEIEYTIKESDKNDPLFKEIESSSTRKTDEKLNRKTQFLINSFAPSHQGILTKFVKYLLIEEYSWNSVDLYTHYIVSYLEGRHESFNSHKALNIDIELSRRILEVFLNFENSL